jgi:two-component system, OmpR family, KDP operon response regulator KdpE
VSEIRSRILVIDDERPIRRFLRTSLASHGYEILEAASGEEGLLSAAQHHPDLIILDLGLPGMDGIEVTRRLREWYQAPIIILSVREQEQDKIAALDAGANDYLTKPFGVGELTARMRASLRHLAKEGENEPVMQIDQLQIDFAHHRVTLAEREIDLTPTEYELLKVLTRHAGKVLTHRQILLAVWGSGYETESHLLRVNISNLRHKIERDPAQPVYLLTEAGVGYRMKPKD